MSLVELDVDDVINLYMGAKKKRGHPSPSILPNTRQEVARVLALASSAVAYSTFGSEVPLYASAVMQQMVLHDPFAGDTQLGAFTACAGAVQANGYHVMSTFDLPGLALDVMAKKLPSLGAIMALLAPEIV